MNFSSRQVFPRHKHCPASVNEKVTALCPRNDVSTTCALLFQPHNLSRNFNDLSTCQGRESGLSLGACAQRELRVEDGHGGRTALSRRGEMGDSRTTSFSLLFPSAFPGYCWSAAVVDVARFFFSGTWCLSAAAHRGCSSDDRGDYFTEDVFGVRGGRLGFLPVTPKAGLFRALSWRR